MTAEVIGAQANNWAQEEILGLGTDGEVWQVLVFPAATWTNTREGRQVIPTWYLCVTLDIGDSKGVAHCEKVAPLAPSEAAVREAVGVVVKILRDQRDMPPKPPVEILPKGGSYMDQFAQVSSVTDSKPWRTVRQPP